MLALIAKMLLCLLIAALIGFIVAWLLRGLRGNPAQQAEIDGLRRDLALRTDRVGSLESELTARQSELSRAHVELGTLRPLSSEVDTLRLMPPKLKVLEGQLGDVQKGWDGEKTAALAAAAAAAAALAKLTSELADKDRALADLDAKFKSGSGLPADAASMRQRVVSLEAELAAALPAGAAAARLKAELATSQKSIADLEAQIRTLQGRLGGIDSKLAECGELRQTAVAQVAALTTERDSLTSRVAALEKAEALRASKPPRQFYSAPAQIDDLEWIYGVGPKLADMLNKLGVYQFRQVAMWNDEDIEFFDRQLEQFHGRIRRENWVQSAIEEQYKKYGDWLGTGAPTVTRPETGDHGPKGESKA